MEDIKEWYTCMPAVPNMLRQDGRNKAKLMMQMMS